MIAAIVIGSIVGVVLLCLLFLWWMRQRRTTTQKTLKSLEPWDIDTLPDEPAMYDKPISPSGEAGFSLEGNETQGNLRGWRKYDSSQYAHRRHRKHKNREKKNK